MAKWLEEALQEEEPVARPAQPLEVLPKATISVAEKQFEEMKAIEDELFRENIQIVQDISKARDIDAGESGIPDEWTRDGRMCRSEAAKSLRVAKASWLCAKEAPVFLGIAKSIVLGIVKARATEKAAPRSLNLTVVNMQTPLPKEFAVVEVEQ